MEVFAILYKLFRLRSMLDKKNGERYRFIARRPKTVDFLYIL